MAEPFAIPTFQYFLHPFGIFRHRDEVGTVASWDPTSALGDTIMEKFESLYVKLVELQNILLSKGAKGYFWIAASSEICSMFQSEFCFRTVERKNSESLLPIDGVRDFGFAKVNYLGHINDRWRLYESEEMPDATILMGCNDRQQPIHHYARLNVLNFS